MRGNGGERRGNGGEKRGGSDGCRSCTSKGDTVAITFSSTETTETSSYHLTIVVLMIPTTHRDARQEQEHGILKESRLHKDYEAVRSTKKQNRKHFAPRTHRPWYQKERKKRCEKNAIQRNHWCCCGIGNGCFGCSPPME